MQIHFVLVAPARPENIGAAARAMKTQGFSSLRLVSSKAHLQPPAEWVAHGAQELLEHAQCFDSLELALRDIDLTIATTARKRGSKRSYWPVKKLNSMITEKHGSINQVALLFGCEESGLSNKALEHADLLSYIPMAVNYPSLNLAQAVMVYAYQLSDLLQPSIDAETAISGRDDREIGEFVSLKHKASKLLRQIDAYDDAKLREWLQDRIGCLSERDIRMLHTLLNDIDKATVYSKAGQEKH